MYTHHQETSQANPRPVLAQGFLPIMSFYDLSNRKLEKYYTCDTLNYETNYSRSSSKIHRESNSSKIPLKKETLK